MELLVMIFFSWVVVRVSLDLLKDFFTWAISTMRAIGAFVGGLVPATIAVFLSTSLMDITSAQASVHFVTTDVITGAISLRLFGHRV